MSSLASRRRRLPAILVLSGLLLAGIGHLPTGWLVITPGDALALSGQVSLSDQQSAGPTTWPGGEVLLLTIMAQPVNLMRMVLTAAGFEGPALIIGRRQMVPPGVTDARYLEISRELMSESIHLAAAAALREAGKPVAIQGDGALVVAAHQSRQGEATGLQPGDVILAIDSQRVRLAGDVASLLRGREPGEVVRAEVLRQGGPTVLELTLRAGSAGAEETMLGALLLSQSPSVELSRSIDIDPAGVGGPSGGLAMALAVYQFVGSEDLLRGRVVAASGTVRPDGTVGSIGGVRLKALAAEQAGASILIVAPADYAEAMAAPTNLRVIAAPSVKAAIESLREP